MPHILRKPSISYSSFTVAISRTTGTAGSERRKQKLDKEWMFMVRTKMPSGTLTAEQYIAHDDMAEKLGNATMRLTTRQGIQLHGILKGGLRNTVRAIANCGLTSWGACGDVVRNTMAPGTPIQ